MIFIIIIAAFAIGAIVFGIFFTDQEFDSRR